MVRKQNERTLLLQYRIIPLSLPTKTLFLILASRPLSTRLGAFSSPRNIFPQIFSEIFSNQTKATFFWIFGAKNYGGKGAFCSPNRGGWSFFARSPHNKLALYSNQHSLTPASLRSPQSLHHSEFSAWRWQKRVESEFFLACFCFFSWFSETTNGAI